VATSLPPNPVFQFIPKVPGSFANIVLVLLIESLYIKYGIPLLYILYIYRMYILIFIVQFIQMTGHSPAWNVGRASSGKRTWVSHSETRKSSKRHYSLDLPNDIKGTVSRDGG
jgi:hypothetical protein